MPSPSRSLFPLSHAKLPEHYLIAHSDGGARGNPGPAGYGVVIQDERGQKVATLSQYLGHQTNNFAEYQGLIAALEYAIEHGHKAFTTSITPCANTTAKPMTWPIRRWTRAQAVWSRATRPRDP